MKVEVRHELPDRLRLGLPRSAGIRARALEAAVRAVEGVRSATVGRRTDTLLVRTDGKPGTRSRLLETLSQLDLASLPETPPDANGEPEEGYLARTLTLFAAGRFLAGPARALLSGYGALPFLWDGARSLTAGRIDSQLLDAAAIGTAMRLGDFGTASTITTLLRLGEHLRLRTEAQAREDLAKRLDNGDAAVWVLRGGVERKAKARELVVGDVVVVRAGHGVPVDGRVVDGRGSVDQSSLTGESEPAGKRTGSTVYDGTVVVDGRLDVEALKVPPETRRSRIVAMVQEASSMKAAAERRAERLADRLTPYIFTVAGLTRATTGDPVRAASVLLVDYSCALKLSIPIAVKTAMIEALKHGIVIRGGRFLEGLAQADTVVFDKTGTLTEAKPRIAAIIPANGFDDREVLKAAACVEEHFPHPVASAILREAGRRGLRHGDEDHGDVRNVVGYGVVSSLHGERFIVGSRRMLTAESVSLKGLPEPKNGSSMIYVAIGRKVAGAFALEDPVRPEAPAVLASLRELGIKRLVLLTGDNVANAQRLAGLGFDECVAEASPEEKAEVVRRLTSEGRRVAMVGDGMNDAPALSLADVGISFRHGTDIARETADVLVLHPRLEAIPLAIRLSRRAMQRVDANFRGIVGVNSLLIGASALGRSSPAGSALAHNMTTLFTSVRSLRPYL